MDVAVTISTLLGLPIPRENVGKIIVGLLLAFPTPVKVEAYRTNVRQLMESYVEIIGDLGPGMIVFLNTESLAFAFPTQENLV